MLKLNSVKIALGTVLVAVGAMQAQESKVTRGKYTPIDHWYRHFKHRVETERGLDDVEDLYAAGTFRVTARADLAGRSREVVVPVVIDLESDRTGRFTAGDLALLERLTLETTLIVRQLWRMRALQAKARQLESLITAGQSLVTKLDPQELFATLTREARQMLQTSACALYLLEPDSNTLRCASLTSLRPTAPPTG